MQERQPRTHAELGIVREVKPHSPLQNKIDREIQDGMNNFDMHLPFDNDDQPSLGGYRAVKRLVGAWDKRHVDWYRENNKDERSFKNHSRRMLYQTGEEFAKTVDEVSATFGISPEEFRRFHRAPGEGGMERAEKMEFKYISGVAPIYRRLRTMGYTEYELTR